MPVLKWSQCKRKCNLEEWPELGQQAPGTTPPGWKPLHGPFLSRPCTARPDSQNQNQNKLICYEKPTLLLKHTKNKHATKQVDMQPQPKKYEATRHPTLLSQKCRTLYFSNDILYLPLIKYLTLQSCLDIHRPKHHHWRSCTKLTARTPLKLQEVEFPQTMLLNCKRVILRVIPLQRRKRQHNQEEQPATRKQVFSPTLEIRSYQQVDRILISSASGCW